MWVFLGLALSLSGVGNLIDPRTFSPVIVLDHTSTVLIQVYAGMSIVGGLMVMAGAGGGARTLERAGWWLVLPTVLMVFVILVFTGTWNRVSIDITYLGFILVILSRISGLKQEIKDLRLAEEALAKLRARQVSK